MDQGDLLALVALVAIILALWVEMVH
jgi:hypothetical protein